MERDRPLKTFENRNPAGIDVQAMRTAATGIRGFLRPNSVAQCARFHEASLEERWSERMTHRYRPSRLSDWR